MLAKVGDFVRSQDSFRQTMALNLEGRDSLQTVRGGIITLITTLSLFYLSIELQQDLVNSSNPSIQSYVVAHEPEGEANLLESKL